MNKNLEAIKQEFFTRGYMMDTSLKREETILVVWKGNHPEHSFIGETELQAFTQAYEHFMGGKE